jgi:Zn-dependent protease with chaperone function
MAMNNAVVRFAVLVAIVSLSATALSAQTAIKLPKNKYTPQQDVALGKEAASEVREQYPIINDENIARYLTSLGDRLVAAAPPELKQSVYEYSFTPVNLKEINAFALPGGPMFVHRGMFDAAASEGEVVGVMAHELSHVLLRHGTANATKASNPWLQIGQIAGQVGGAMMGGAVGSAIAQGSQFGLGAMLLRYSRDYEKQADLLGTQIMARAGYDPRSLGHMFETIAKEAGGSGNPQWLSSHPDPGNRTAYINKEAETLTIGTPADMSGFSTIKTTFASLPPAKTMGELAKAKGGGGNGGGGGAEGNAMEASAAVGTPGQPVPKPSAQYREITGGKILHVSIPSDWTTIPAKSSLKVIPQNGYGPLNGQTVFSHGVEFGITPASSRDLQEATKAWLNAVAQSNPDLKLAGQQQAIKISQRTAIATPLVNTSPLGGPEQVGVYTTFLADGSLFYYLTVAPEKDAAAFQEAFQKIGQSIRLTEAR